jgi:uncharacterized membrane protein YidH (DUF202 family)
MPAKRKARRPRKKSSKPEPHKNNKHKMTLEEERTLFVKEQTVLAKERTILSFMRTGLGFITAGFAIIAATAILEVFFKMSPMTSFVIGWGIVIVGFIEIIESFRRLRVYREKMREITEELGDESV